MKETTEITPSTSISVEGTSLTAGTAQNGTNDTTTLLTNTSQVRKKEGDVDDEP